MFQTLPVALVFASSLTKIHPGAGRSPGVVDLPVLRDPLGYPYIPGTMIKGSLRTLATRESSKPSSDNNSVKTIECLFGPDVNARSKHAGALTFHDLYPLLIPAPSSEYGVVYVTTPSLLGRAATMAEAAGETGLASIFTSLAKGASDKAILVGAQKGGEARVGAFRIKYNKYYNINRLDELIREVQGLHKLYETVPLQGRIMVVPESVGVRVIESLLVRVTRVRLDRNTKTVAKGGLWTEEYIPWGTLFIGIIVDNKFRGANCKNMNNPIDTIIQLLGIGENQILDIVVGGKETVGGGLFRLKLVQGGKT